MAQQELQHGAKPQYGLSNEEYEQLMERSKKKSARKKFHLPVGKVPYAVSNGKLKDDEMNGFRAAGLSFS
jgi:hypothetical protein